MNQKHARIATLGTMAAGITNLFASPFASALNLSIEEGASSARGVDQAVDLFGSTGVFTTVTNVMLFVVGAISVIMIVIGGLRYVISGGNTANVTAAKNTILYAIVGLVVAILAYAMVNFVISTFAEGVSGGGGTNV